MNELLEELLDVFESYAEDAALDGGAIGRITDNRDVWREDFERCWRKRKIELAGELKEILKDHLG